MAEASGQNSDMLRGLSRSVEDAADLPVTSSRLWQSFKRVSNACWTDKAVIDEGVRQIDASGIDCSGIAVEESGR